MHWTYLFIPAAYLAGSLASAVIVARLLGLDDPRTVGSGNPGATNILRHGGKKAAALTLLGDVLKGVIPVLVAKAFTDDSLILAATAGAAFLGHLFPIFFGFRGGKGVATAAGVLLALHWPLGLAVLGVWIAMALISRISSLSALTAAVAAPFLAWWLTGDQHYIALCAGLSALLILRHHSNIRNLINGTEGRIGTR